MKSETLDTLGATGTKTIVTGVSMTAMEQQRDDGLIEGLAPALTPVAIDI